MKQLYPIAFVEIYIYIQSNFSIRVRPNDAIKTGEKKRFPNTSYKTQFFYCIYFFYNNRKFFKTPKGMYPCARIQLLRSFIAFFHYVTSLYIYNIYIQLGGFCFPKVNGQFQSKSWQIYSTISSVSATNIQMKCEWFFVNISLWTFEWRQRTKDFIYKSVEVKVKRRVVVKTTEEKGSQTQQMKLKSCFDRILHQNSS